MAAWDELTQQWDPSRGYSFTGGVPGRGASDQNVDAWNQRWRSSPLYQEALASIRVDPARLRQTGLTEQQRQAVENYMAQRGMPVPKGMHIDPAGNLNQENKLWRNIGTGAAIGGAALTGFGLAGLGPLSGLAGLGGGAAVAPTAAGAVAPTAAGTGTALGGVSTSGLFAPTGLVGTGAGTGTALAGGAGTALGGGSALAPTVAGGGASIWGKLKGLLPGNVGDALGLATGIGGAVFGQQSQSQASQRQAELAARLAEEDINQRRRGDLWNQLLQREQEGRAGRDDAWKQLQQSEYVASGGRPYKAPEWGTSFGFGPQARTAGEQAGARTLSERSQNYLAKGPESLVPNVPTEPYAIDRSLVKPGAWEQISGLIGTGLTGFGSWQQGQQRRQEQQAQQQQQDADRKAQQDQWRMWIDRMGNTDRQLLGEPTP